MTPAVAPVVARPVIVPIAARPALAPMLAAGSQSWDITLVAGADLDEYVAKKKASMPDAFM